MSIRVFVIVSILLFLNLLRQLRLVIKVFNQLLRHDRLMLLHKLFAFDFTLLLVLLHQLNLALDWHKCGLDDLLRLEIDFNFTLRRVVYVADNFL